MLSLVRLRFRPDHPTINLLLSQASSITLTSLMSLVIFHGYLLIQESNGGSDLVSADVPKSLMLLNGQNPYSTQPWASPYPPLLLLTVSGIIRLNTLFASQSSIDLISQQLRLAGLLADAAAALIIYLAIRTRTGNALQTLILISLLNTILPSSLQFTPTEFFTNQIWFATTAALYTFIVGTVWTKAQNLTSIDVVLLGLVAWLIPLRIVYAHYIVWAIIPFLMRGRLVETIVIVGLLQFADTLAYWSSTPSISPIPSIAASYGPVLTSLVIRIIGATALVFVLNSIRKNPIRPRQEPDLQHRTIL